MKSPFQEILSIAHHREAALDPLLEVTVQPIAPRAPNEDVFAYLAVIGSRLENLYQSVTVLVANGYKYGDPSDVYLVDSIQTLAQNAGFEPGEATDFAYFSTQVRPTYAQLTTWRAELAQDGKTSERIEAMLAKYDRVAAIIASGQRDNSTFLTAMLADTIMPPTPTQMPQTTWSEHASATFMTTDYMTNEDAITVNRIRLMLAVDSREAAAEYLTGRLLRRS